MDKNSMKNLEFITNGVAISPASPTIGDHMTILYDGILSKNGASDVTMHLGYGNDWSNEQDIPMIKRSTCFEATIPALRKDFLKISFKDTNNNIDDNDGDGYTFTIQQ